VGITYAARSSSNTRGGLAVAIKMQIRRGLAAAWASANPTLEPGELGFVTDAGTTAFKIGDGTTVWNSLAYVNSTYPELPVDASLNLNLALAQGRYPLSSANTYTSTPAIPAAEYVQGATDGNSVLTVTVPSNGIVIQQINTSVTAKQFLRAYNGTTWTSWKRIDTLAAAESLSIASITLTGNLTVGTTSGVLSIPLGSAPAPSLTFTGDTNTGVYSALANSVNIATDGVQRVAVGTALTTVTTPLAVTGLVTANAGSGSPALLVAAGNTSLKYTEVAGILKVMPDVANRFIFNDTATGTLASYNFYMSSSPYLTAKAKTSGGTTTDAELLWAGYNRLGSQTTSIRTDGVPTNASDLTTKSYVDTAVSAVTFREMMIIAVDNSDTNYIVGGTVVTGVINNSLSIRIISSGATAPTVTYASNLASSTVTWTTGVPSGTRRCLFPSAGTWSVACGVGVDAKGLSFTAIRTA
jgi:hypothetical protein